MNSLAREAARGQLAKGRAPVPVRGKTPWDVATGKPLEGWQRLRLTEADLPVAFGDGVTGIGVLNGSPSKGLIDVDLDGPEAFAVADTFLPTTGCIFGRASRRRSHREYISDPLADTAQFKDVGGKMLIELRSTGSQTIWPGSIHPEGEAITFDTEGEPLRVDGQTLRINVACVATCAMLAKHWPRTNGSRHDIANALAGFLLRGGVGESLAVKLVETAAQQARDEEWRERGKDVRATAKARRERKKVTGGPTLADLLGEKLVAKLTDWLGLLSRGAARAAIDAHDASERPEDSSMAHDGRVDAQTGGDAQPEHPTDLGNAQRLVRHHGADLRYCAKLGGWFVWDGRRWALNETGEVERRATATVIAMYAEASAITDDEERRQLVKHAGQSEAERRLRAMIALAASRPGIAMKPEQFDRDCWLLNVENGTLDLRTGKPRSHRREDLITKLAPVVYDPKATCPTFDAFVGRIFDNKPDVIGFVQRAGGAALIPSYSPTDWAQNIPRLAQPC